MRDRVRRRAVLALLVAGMWRMAAAADGQRVLQRGPAGRPTTVMDETEQWTTPTLAAGDRDVEIYLPDLTSPSWLKANYRAYEDRGQYVITMFTFYRTPAACRVNQTGWGLADAAHLNACEMIGYRVRQGTVDTGQKTVTLIMAAMLDQDGTMDEASVQRQSVTRNWVELDANTRKAVEVANEVVARQMKLYDARVQRSR